MPEQPDRKRRRLAGAPVPRAAIFPYAELHCKTNFSFLEGASHPDELVYRAAELGYAALAITDRNSLAGVVRAHGTAKDLALKLLIGAELTPTDAPAAVLLATDRKSYGRLCRLLTIGRRSAPKGECHVTFDDLAGHADGLLAAVVGDAAPEALCRYREVFADRCYLLVELHHGPHDERRWSSASSSPNGVGCRWWLRTMCIFTSRAAGPWRTCSRRPNMAARSPRRANCCFPTLPGT